MLRTLSAATSALRPALPSAAAAWSAAPIAAAAQPAAAAVFARSFAHAAPRAAAAESSSASSGSAPSSSSAPRTIPGSHRPFKKAPRPELPFPARVPLAVPQGESGMDASGHWHESAPKHPSFKEAIASEVYTNAEVRGSGHIKPKHLNSPVAVFGIGVPSQRQSMPPPLRRTLKPHSVQDVPIPMKTYTKGPREMGHKIVRTFLGHVTSDKMQKTIAVEVSQFYRHPKYHKYIKTSKKFLTHDENEECNVGDVVEIRVCRPMSKRKHFTLHRIIKPKLDIEDAAKIFVAGLPEWKRGEDYKTVEQLVEEQKKEDQEFDEMERAVADEEAREAMEASEQRQTKA